MTILAVALATLSGLCIGIIAGLVIVFWSADRVSLGAIFGAETCEFGHYRRKYD